MSGHNPNRAEERPTRNTDYLLIFTGVVALASMVVLYASDKNILPEIVSTYTMQPVLFFNKAGLADSFESRAVYEASGWWTKYNLHPMGAIKYSLGCFGEDSLDLFTGRQPADLFTTMAGLQVKWDTNSSISVCTCLDHHTSLAMPQTVALAASIRAALEAMGANRSRFQNSALHSLVTGKLTGNLYIQPTNNEFETIVQIKNWCQHTAAPQYSTQFASVFHTKLLLLVALSLVFVSLDVLDVRKKQYNASDDRNVWVWFLDIIPLIFFLVQFFRFQTESKMHTVVETGSVDRNSFLLVLTIITGGVSVALLVLLTFFSKTMDNGAGTGHRYNSMFERVFMDVPMVAGLALLGIALKMQNAEHDETILFSTYVLLLGAGLVQHISNIIKIAYDVVCTRLLPEVLHELQGASDVHPKHSEEDIRKTRHILQYFGWTRVYGFGVVIIFAAFSLTLSSTSASTHNPLSVYTQNQYMYFVFIFVTALTGLDFFYEVLPFVTESDTEYGVAAADRLRKFAVLGYIIFVMVSQYTTESQEL